MGNKDCYVIKRKVSTHVSLSGLQKLTQMGTFCKCIKPLFHRALIIFITGWLSGECVGLMTGWL